jgi:site-specific recombinase XerD
MTSLDSTVSFTLRGTRKIDLKSALAQQEQSNTVAAYLLFSELCRAYSSTHYDGSDLQLRKWIDLFEGRNAWSITSQELDRAGVAMIEHGYAPATVNRNISQIGSLYKWAARRRITPAGFRSPTIGMARYEEQIRRVELSAQEVSKLIDGANAIKDRRFAVLVRLLIDTGARRSEVLERNWGQVNMERQEILAPETKIGIPRVLFFSAETKAFMERVWSQTEMQNKSAMLFESKRVQLQPISFKKHWLWLVASIERPDLRMHDLRHHRAKQMLDSGAPIAVAAQALGHSSQILSRRYGHLETTSMKRVVTQSW